jgi:hypothetical protein
VAAFGQVTRCRYWGIAGNPPVAKVNGGGYGLDTGIVRRRRLFPLIDRPHVPHIVLMATRTVTRKQSEVNASA